MGQISEAPAQRLDNPTAISIEMPRNATVVQMLLKIARAAMMAAQKITTKSWQHR
jgi:hypothetical protein